MPSRIHLDECVDRVLIDLLGRRGFDVTAAREAGLLSASDGEQLAYATAQGRTIVTHNGRDFFRLHAQALRADQAHAGIVVLPSTGGAEMTALRAALLLDWLDQSHGAQLRLVKWNDVQYQLTQGARLPGYSEEDVRWAMGHRP